jgi:hypothetical protein
MKSFWTFLLFGLTACSDSGKGLEIYRVRKDFPDHTQVPQSDCYYCLDIQEEDLMDEPILTEADFEKFDWEKQVITLSDNGKNKFNQLEIPLVGYPVAFAIDGKPVYSFWFWNYFSSHGCDRVYTTLLGDQLELEFGHIEPYGSDPRFNEELERYVNNKLRQ